MLPPHLQWETMRKAAEERERSTKCGYDICPTCKEMVQLTGHKCFMQPSGPLDDKIEPTFIVFDLETYQTETYGKKEEEEKRALGARYIHKPNLCIAYKFCDNCKDAVLNQKIFDSCNQCGDNLKTFEGPNTMDEFGHWLYEENKGSMENPTLAFAHNAKGYDGQFLLNYLTDNGYKVKNIIKKGSSIMLLECNGIKLKDSLNFLPMKLASIPKAFGFKELKKGYFPHYFNCPANEEYNGIIPDHHYYGTSSMKPEDRIKFFEWYNPLKEAKQQFNLKKERWEYCNSDVAICASGIMKFREMLKEMNGVDPLLECTTIASTTNKVFTRNFLAKDTIGLIPPGGFRRNEKQSFIAIKWLKWISVSQNIQIQHARNMGEKIIKFDNGHTLKVDGYTEINGEKIVYQFQGCAFHGCRKCYRDRDTKMPFGNMTMEDKYQQTLRTTQMLESRGYKVVEMWECQLKKALKDSPKMKEFIDSLEEVAPLDPRDALFGGRTNATKLYHKCEGQEKIAYKDVCSLYPCQLMFEEYFIGHPDIITENFKTINKTQKPYKGLIKCTVQPPRKLYHPVLPHRDSKTLFPLCRTCAEEKERKMCKHSNEERQLTGTWTHPELYKAVDLGYVVTKIYEVYHWKKWEKFNGKDGGLFSQYIQTFMQVKQEASGWPSWVKTETDQENFIKQCEKKNGIKLDPEKVEKNAGLRQLAKLMLNSFWGKFAQRENMPKTTYCNPEEWFKMFNDETLEISEADLVGTGNMEKMMVKYRYKEEFIVPNDKVNVAIASYVTSYARLHLYRYLEALQQRVLYFDTDSVIYLCKPGQKDLPSGYFLGELTDELEEYGKGSYIKEFTSAGPKNYSYTVQPPEGKVKRVVKVKGFPLDFTSLKHINAISMKNKVKAFVKNGCHEIIPVVQPMIRTMPKDNKKVTMMVRKQWKVVYDKRMVLPDFTTLPYGY